MRASGRILLILLGLQAGCPGDGNPGTDEERTDLAAPAPDLGCVRTPRTHVEILNACTEAQSVDKRPVLPLLRSDGTLPPLP